MKLNKGALKFTAVYIAFFALLSGLAFFADPKGSFVFGQLAIFPGAAFITWTGLIKFIAGGLLAEYGTDFDPAESGHRISDWLGPQCDHQLQGSIGPDRR